MTHRSLGGRGPLVLVVAICTLLTALLPAGGATTPVAASFGSTNGGTQVPNGPVSCDGLVSGTTLIALVAQYYPNASLLPSEDQAEAAVTTLWNTLCASATFQSALSFAVGGWFEYSSDMQDKNRTASGDLVGSLFVDFELTWNASCPSMGPGFPEGFGCQFQDTWQANLTAQSVLGPAVKITSLRFVPCDTPDANNTAVGSVEGFYPAPGTSPNESVAVQEVQAIWGAVCTSAAYYDLAAPLDMPQALSFSTWRATPGLNGTLSTSGHLYFEWSLFLGDRPCASENDSALSGLNCSYSESWTADLTTDTYSGPAASSFPLFGGTVRIPPYQGNNTTPPWGPVAVAFGAFSGVIVVAGLLGVAERRRT